MHPVCHNLGGLSYWGQRDAKSPIGWWSLKRPLWWQHVPQQSLSNFAGLQCLRNRWRSAMRNKASHDLEVRGHLHSTRLLPLYDVHTCFIISLLSYMTQRVNSGGCCTSFVIVLWDFGVNLLDLKSLSRWRMTVGLIWLVGYCLYYNFSALYIPFIFSVNTVDGPVVSGMYVWTITIWPQKNMNKIIPSNLVSRWTAFKMGYFDSFYALPSTVTTHQASPVIIISL